MTELPTRPKPPTIREVARAAGVSTALVSIVLRGAPGASQETRARVFAVAEQVGYRAKFTLQANAPVGAIKQEVFLETNDPASQLVPVVVEATIQALLTVSPGALSGGCEISSDRFAAHCRIGKGRAAVVAVGAAELVRPAGRICPRARSGAGTAAMPRDLLTQAAQRAGEEANGVGGQRRQGARERVEGGEEQLVEHQGGGRAVEEEVVPLDGRADEAGQHHARERRRGPDGFVHGRSPGEFQIDPSTAGRRVGGRRHGAVRRLLERPRRPAVRRPASTCSHVAPHGSRDLVG